MTFRYIGAAVLLIAFTSSLVAQEKIVAAADVGYPPYAMATPDGEFEGMDIAIAKALSEQLGIEISVIDQPWSATIPGLNAGKFDMILAPATITEERAQDLAFTEGYGDALYSFLINAGGVKVASPDDLRGRVVATNKGNIFDRWLTEREAEYGWTINRFDKFSDAAAAVAVGQADAAMMYTAAAGWLAKESDRLEVSEFTLDSGQAYGYVFRVKDVVLRNKVDAALECLKSSGRLAEIYKEWTGLAPMEGGKTVIIEACYGEPGFPHYDPAEHEAECK